MSDDTSTPDIALEDITDNPAQGSFDLKSALRSKDFMQALALGSIATLFLLVFVAGYSALTAKHTYQTLTAELAHEIIHVTVAEKPLPHRAVKKVTAHEVDQQKHDSHDEHDTTAQHESNETISQETSDATQALPRAPIAAVTEETAQGPMPKLSDDENLTPFNAYKKPVVLGPDTGPVIALGIQDYGLSARLSQQALSALPDSLTLLISPYVPDAQTWVDRARTQGFETWINIPFETQNYPQHDTGAQTLLKRSSLKLNMDKFTWALSRASGYAGVYAHLDETFLHSESMLKSLFNVLFMRGAAYLELAPRSNQQIESISIAHNAPYIGADLVFTQENMPDAIDALIDAAKTNKVAIGITTINPAMVAELPSWIKKIKDSNITLVPISAAYEYKWTQYE